MQRIVDGLILRFNRSATEAEIAEIKSQLNWIIA